MRRVLAAGAVALVAALAGCGGDPVPPAKGPTGVFPAPPRSDTARVWAVGDADSSPGSKRLAALIGRSRPTRLLYLGDIYESGTARDFRSFDSAWGGLKRRTLPTPGNHDWPEHAKGYNPYWGTVTGQRPPSYYAVRAGGWQIVSLNSEEPLDAGSPQLRWLRSQVRGSGTCRLVFWHRPRYSAGRHGDQGDVAPLWDAVRGRAALVVNGHDHDMQQLRPDGGTSELVSGAGGHSHYSVDREYGRLVWTNDRDNGAVRIDLRSGRARFAFISVDGRPLHAGTVSCRP